MIKLNLIKFKVKKYIINKITYLILLKILNLIKIIF